MDRTVSIVVPMYNEEQNVEPLVAAMRSALGSRYDWELLLVDDGSTDATVERIRRAAEDDARVRLIRLARNYGQTPAMQAGFDAAAGDVVVTMDGDLQNDPRDIPKLLDRLDEGYDLVAGYRVDRKDKTVTRKIPSWFANRIIRAITRVDIRDNGCSLKAYRAELLRRMHLYSDMHRFIPAVAAGTAGAKITELPVRHHARKYGSSKYGLSRVGKVLADLITVLMIRSFRRRPLMLFAAAGLTSGAFGLVFLAAAAINWITGTVPGRVIFSGAFLLCSFLAMYLLLVGLVAETVVGELEDGAGAEVITREIA